MDVLVFIYKLYQNSFSSVIDGCSLWNYSEPIWVSLRHLSPGTDAMAVQWSLKGLEQHGGWSQEGCQLVHSDSSTSTMRCSVLSNYAVLQVRHSGIIKHTFIQEVI